MTAALVLLGLYPALAFGAGWMLRGRLEASNQRRRRGGYVRRVPMSSVHPREPKP
jgi:hypothetical protein